MPVLAGFVAGITVTVNKVSPGTATVEGLAEIAAKRVDPPPPQTTGAVEAFRGMRINPLTPLRGKAFRPTFAETNHTQEGSQYEAVLDRVQAEWDIAGLDRLGGSHD